MNDPRALTELEGAVLTEIAHRGNDTAYKVRRAFQLSPSHQWRGSAGAVSPAIHRLVKRRLIVARAHPTRRGQLLELSAEGHVALNAWASDVELACGVGLDPFRLRAGVWEALPENQRSRLFEALLAELQRGLAARQDAPEAFPELPQPKELARELLASRVRWLKSRMRRS